MTPDRADSCLKIARSAARLLGLRGANEDDSTSCALLALVEREGEFDPMGGVGWETFAARIARGAVRGWISRAGRRRDTPIAGDRLDDSPALDPPIMKLVAETDVERAVIQLIRAGRSMQDMMRLTGLKNTTIARAVKRMKKRNSSAV